MPKKRAWHHPFPRFSNPDGSETLAGEILRLCAREEGMLGPWTNSPRYNHSMQARRNMLDRLWQLGLVQELRTGPRNGKYWHTTERGDLITQMLALGPKQFRASFTLVYG